MDWKVKLEIKFFGLDEQKKNKQEVEKKKKMSHL